MPSRTSELRSHGLLPPGMFHASHVPRKHKLRPVTPDELEFNDDSDATLDDSQPEDLDEPWPYTFKSGDRVWIRTIGGNWYPGTVSGQTARKGQTRQKEGYFYPVIFCEKIRKYFAPLNGEIKPDNAHVRCLLREAGWT